MLGRLGIATGDVLFLHSGLGWFGGGLGAARSLLVALLEAIGPSGTLFMPSYPWTDDRNGMSMQSHTFDVRSSPARTGILCELFRRWPGVMRSEHLWVPVCGHGPLAAAMLDSQLHVVNAFAGDGFFHRLYAHDAKLVGLGVSLNTSSATHVLDADLRDLLPADIFVPIEGRVVDRGGQTHDVRCEVFSPDASRSYNIRAIFAERPALRAQLTSFQAGSALCFSYPLSDFRAQALDAGRAALATGRLPPWLVAADAAGTGAIEDSAS